MNLETKLKEIKARCDGATDGPYFLDYVEPNEGYIRSRKYNRIIMDFSTDDACQETATQDDKNMRLFAHSRTDVSMLLEIVEDLVVKIKACQKGLGYSCFEYQLNSIEKIAEKYKN